MGHENVQLMQGSLEDWKAAGGPLEEGSTTVPLAKDMDVTKSAQYKARDPVNVIAMDKMMQFVENGQSTIVDPRGSSFERKGFIFRNKYSRLC